METPSSKRRLAARDAENQALDLRRAGKTFREIARVMGVADTQAHKLVTNALHRLNTQLVEKADDVRRLELERLDRWLDALEDKILAGDEKAVAVAIKLMERRAKYLALDAAAPEQKIQLTYGPEYLQQLQGDLAARLSPPKE